MWWFVLQHSFLFVLLSSKFKIINTYFISLLWYQRGRAYQHELSAADVFGSEEEPVRYEQASVSGDVWVFT